MDLNSRIGNTPLIKLNRISPENGAGIYVKFEGANPTGSMKDRMAFSMIEGAEKSGQLKKGGTVIEYTGGSTGSALAMVCAVKGYRAYLVSSDAFSNEKIQSMKLFGAEIEIIKSKEGKINAELIQSMRLRVEELNERSDTFWIDQFNNIDNRRGYHPLAHEILHSLGPNIDEFIAGVGTGGCFSGVSEILKEKIPSITCVATEPFNVRALSGGDMKGSHRLEGMGIGFVPSICRMDLADKIMPIRDKDAYETAKLLALKEGIFGGISSGANVWAAIQRAKLLGPDKKVVTIICDTGLKYLQGDLYSA